MTRWRRYGARAWHAIRPDTVRRAVSGVMIIMALGRLGLYASRPLTSMLSDSSYGGLLLVLGLALYVGRGWQRTVLGRLIAALSALLLFTMAWDAAGESIGVTALIEGWLAALLVYATFTDGDCA